MSRVPLYSICKAFAEIRREESCLRVMVQDKKHALPFTSKTFSLVTHSLKFNKSKGKLVCDQCIKNCHMKDSCWDLYGKPIDWKLKKGKGGSRIYMLP